MSTISNVDISDENYNENISENLPLISTPKPTELVGHPCFSVFSDISDACSDYDTDNDIKSKSRTVNSETATNDDNNNEIKATNNIATDKSYRTESLISENVENIGNDPVPSSSLNHRPYEVHDSQVFNLFDVNKLEDSTSFTHLFTNRSSAYYGPHPYCYGSTTHKPRDFSENSYLQKILNYAEVAYPTLKFNSAMINKYDSGKYHIPYHSDNENDIEEHSLILTISLGETRTLQFKEVGESCWSESVGLCHGDSLLMSKDSQKYFKHGIPQESTSSKRLSITLRLITPKILYIPKEMGTQTVSGDDYVQRNIPVSGRYQPDESKLIASPTTTRGIHTPHDKRVFSQCDGYQATEPIFSPHTPSTSRTVDTLYISSSMFRYMNATKLSTKQQKADVLFLSWGRCLSNDASSFSRP